MDAVDVDERIRAMLRRGEQEDARALLVAQYDGKVIALCRGMVRDPVLAEDLKQDTFVRAFAALPEHRGEASLAAWLLRIARNRCIDHLRQRDGRWVAAIDPDDPPDLASASPIDVIDGLQRAERGLAILEPEERALVLLHHVHGIDYAELAETFETTEGALRMRMARALARMRTEIELLDGMKRIRSRRITVPRSALWAAILLSGVALGITSVYYGVVEPQREQAAALAARIEAMQAQAAEAQRALEAAQASGASEEELRRLRDELAEANASQEQTAVHPDDPALGRVMRPSTVASSMATGSSQRRLPDGGLSTASGGCMGPLCAIMRP